MAYKPDKHGRDHCPGGEDPIPCLSIYIFRAYRRDTSVTVAGATSIVVDWDYWENGAEGVFAPLDVTLDPADPDEVIRRVELNVEDNPGRYTFFFGAVPSSNITGTTLLTMHDGDDLFGFPDGAYHGAFSGGLEPAFMVLNISRVYPMFDPLDEQASPFQISFGIAQSGGSSETFNPCWMEIHYERNVVFPMPPPP